MCVYLKNLNLGQTRDLLLPLSLPAQASTPLSLIGRIPCPTMTLSMHFTMLTYMSLTFLVTNLVKHLMITKLSDNFADNFVTKFCGSPNWVKEQLLTFCTWCPLHPRKDLHWEFYSEPPQQKPSGLVFELLCRNFYSILNVVWLEMVLTSRLFSPDLGFSLVATVPATILLSVEPATGKYQQGCQIAVEKFWQVKLLERVMITCDLTHMGPEDPST